MHDRVGNSASSVALHNGVHHTKVLGGYQAEIASTKL
jgi:hypothetical protein